MNITVKPIITSGVRKLEAGLRAGVINQVNRAMMRIAGQAKRALESHTAGWSNPPSFSVSGSAQIGRIEISTTDRKFIWVDDGVPPHVIFARKKFMRFPAGYAAKTTPGRVIRGSGAYSGGLVYAKKVNHPGIRARKITKAVQEQTQRNMKRVVDEAIAAALK